MVAPITFDTDNDDLNAYNDEKIAAFLLNLQAQSLEDLLKAQTKIADEYAKATQAYEADRSTIRWARRRYWLLIFVGVFKEIWRVLIKGKESKISQLKQKKENLKEQFREKDEDYNTQMTLVHDSIERIQLYANEVSQRMRELADLKEVIENLDAMYLKLDDNSDPQDKLEIEQQLAQHIEDREILNRYIHEASVKTELLVNGLSGLLDNYSQDYVPKDFLASQRKANLEKIALIKEHSKEVNHPIISKLLAFLSRQTAASLQVLQVEIAKDKSIFKDRVVGDIVWEANNLYPAIFLGKNREQILFDYVAMKENELATLQEVIEATDSKLQTHDNPERRKLLDTLVQDRDKITGEISHLLLVHRDVLSGNHTELLEKVHGLAHQQSDGARMQELKRLFARTKHPLVKKMDYFLTYRTTASLQALKSAMAEDPSYLESRELVHIIEEAGRLDGRITEGWVKEMELPSIKDIQQHYIHSITDRLQALNERHANLTDQRVDMVAKIHSLEKSLRQLDEQYNAITGQAILSYLPRAKLDVIRKNGTLFQQYEQVKQEYKKVQTAVHEMKKELDVLNQDIGAVEEEQEKCVVVPVLFTPEAVQSLMERCYQVTRLGRVHPVAAALGAFLNYPTPSLLTKLKLAMQEHDVQKNPKIVQLLHEANQYFPYIQREGQVAKAHWFDFFQEHKGDASHETEHDLNERSQFGAQNNQRS